jgi:hypothetical protein
LASRWRERETEREGPAFVPTDVDDIALHKDGLLLMGHKGGAVTYAPSLLQAILAWRSSEI